MAERRQLQDRPRSPRSHTLVVTIDGPAGVGKSTMARGLAAALGIPYLDTGAMFRAVALKLGPAAKDFTEEELARALQGLKFTLSGQGEGSEVLCNGQPLGQAIRNEEVGALASVLAARPALRAFLKEAQQAIGRAGSLVAEGRDMGTAVFPGAPCKFFLDAAPEVRARRRQLQLREQGEEADLAILIEQIRQRDTLDRERAVAPLRPAPDAALVDTSFLTPGEVLDRLQTEVYGRCR